MCLFIFSFSFLLFTGFSCRRTQYTTDLYPNAMRNVCVFPFLFCTAAVSASVKMAHAHHSRYGIHCECTLLTERKALVTSVVGTQTQNRESGTGENVAYLDSFRSFRVYQMKTRSLPASLMSCGKFTVFIHQFIPT